MKLFSGVIAFVPFEVGVLRRAGEFETIVCSICELIVAVYMLYFTVNISFRMSKALWHDFGFGLGLLTFIFTFILDLENSKYIGNSTLKIMKNQ